MNVSSVVNHFSTANKGFITTLGSTISAGATTIPLTSVSGLTNGSIFVGIIEPGLANEQEFTGTVDTAGVQLTGVKWTDGTNVDHTAGVTIVDYVAATDWNMITKGILVEHGQDGTHDSTIVAKLAGAQTFTGVKTFEQIKFNAPQGFLINGRLDVSVATNNITVAIKGLDGNNPSATNPVYCRIGNTVRSITSALSVTKNAGTNWFNSGSSETATQEIDYFTYLGYNATDGVVIGFARIPHARTYGDFSATTTNDKYCAISTITNATSTDQYEVVGRFNATLSATAAFNWSIPATSVVINRPIFTTRPLVYTPTVSSSTGSFTTVSSGAEYTITDKEVFVYAGTTITTNGTAAGSVVNSLPITAASTQTYLGYGRADGVSGKQLQAKVNTTTTMSIFNYDGTYPGANGESIRVRYNYKSA